MSKTFRFSSRVCFNAAERDGYMKHYVPVPDEVAEPLLALLGEKQRRVVGTIEDHRFSRVLQVAEAGEARLRFGESWLRSLGLDVGLPVDLTLGADPDPDHVEVPSELAEALEAEPAAAELWRTLSAGKRRTWVYGVERAKRPETRHKRAAKVVAELEALLDARAPD
ncbi:MAG: YdeI/OmpD-associated family protein [Myxococcota bacterium]